LGTNGGKVLLLDGTYNLNSSLTLKDNTTIEGMGPKATTIKQNYQVYVLYSSNKRNITIRNLCLANLSSSYGVIYFISSENINLKDLAIESADINERGLYLVSCININIDNIYGKNMSCLIPLHNCKYINISNINYISEVNASCLSYTYRGGIYLQVCSYVNIENVSIEIHQLTTDKISNAISICNYSSPENGIRSTIFNISNSILQIYYAASAVPASRNNVIYCEGYLNSAEGRKSLQNVKVTGCQIFIYNDSGISIPTSNNNFKMWTLVDMQNFTLTSCNIYPSTSSSYYYHSNVTTANYASNYVGIKL
jgi:hypothetical protein